MGAPAYSAVLLFALALAVAAAETARPEEPTLPSAADGDAGVVATAGRHNVTIFAPRNEALERDLDPEFKRFLLEPRNLKSLQTLLLFHVLPARHPAGSWPAASHPTLSGASLSSRQQGRRWRRSLCPRERKRKEMDRGGWWVRKRRRERCVGGGPGRRGRTGGTQRDVRFVSAPTQICRKFGMEMGPSGHKTDKKNGMGPHVGPSFLSIWTQTDTRGPNASTRWSWPDVFGLGGM